MTLATTITKVSYSGDGTTTAFAVSFPFVKDADVHAVLVTDGVEAALTQGTDYTLSGAGESTGGTLTMTAAPASGKKLTIYRSPAIVQETDYVENSAFPAETLEDALDLLTMIGQALQEKIDRAVLYPVSTSASDILDSTDFLDATTANRTAAAAAQTAAETAEAAARTSETNAAASATAAAASAQETAAIKAGGTVEVSSADTTPGYLGTKLLAGTGLTAATGNAGADETLTLAPAIATDAECETGTAADRLTTPAGVQAHFASKLATQALTDAGADDATFVSPLKLATRLAALQFVPAGSVVAVASETVPSGYLECDGSAVSRTTYADLYAAIGTIHGTGDGSTTFNLPDYRGRFLRGWDHGAGRDPDAASRTAMATGGNTGDQVGSIQADMFESHLHWTGFCSPTGSGSANTTIGTGRSNCAGDYNTSSNGGNETRPINANVMYCIKY